VELQGAGFEHDFVKPIDMSALRRVLPEAAPIAGAT
jgi:hypothetical protein